MALKAAAVLILLSIANTAIAADCPYVSPVNGDSIIVEDDQGTPPVLHWTVLGGAEITCTTEDNRLARGPFPANCSNGESNWDTSYSFFPSASGEDGATLVMANEVYYRRCD